MEKEESQQNDTDNDLIEQLKAASLEMNNLESEIKKEKELEDQERKIELEKQEKQRIADLKKQQKQQKQDAFAFEKKELPKQEAVKVDAQKKPETPASQTQQPIKQESVLNTPQIQPTPKVEQTKLSTEPTFVSFDQKNTQTENNINREELSIEDLHADLESKLTEQGFIFDKKKFIFNDKNLTLGEKFADEVASFGGSWKFIIMFGCFIFLWIAINVFWFMNQGYDPYPFILLNLILSCLASLQAPIIMMSQNRHGEKARRQEEINIEKEILDFKQDRLDLILDQKQWDLLRGMDARLKNMEQKLSEKKKQVKASKKKSVKQVKPAKKQKKVSKKKSRR